MTKCMCKTVAATAIGAAGLMTGCASTAGPGGGSMVVASAERADCPGKIICPITGELICADQCPAGSAGTAGKTLAASTPSCCAPKQ